MPRRGTNRSTRRGGRSTCTGVTTLGDICAGSNTYDQCSDSVNCGYCQWNPANEGIPWEGDCLEDGSPGTSIHCAQAYTCMGYCPYGCHNGSDSCLKIGQGGCINIECCPGLHCSFDTTVPSDMSGVCIRPKMDPKALPHQTRQQGGRVRGGGSSTSSRRFSGRTQNNPKGKPKK